MSWFCPLWEETLTLWWQMKPKEFVPWRYPAVFKNNHSLSRWGLGNESGQRMEQKGERGGRKRVRTWAGTKGRKEENGALVTAVITSLLKSNQNVYSHCVNSAAMMNVSVCTADIWAFITTFIPKRNEKTSVQQKWKDWPRPKTTVYPLHLDIISDSCAHTRTHTLWKALYINEGGFI